LNGLRKLKASIQHYVLDPLLLTAEIPLPEEYYQEGTSLERLKSGMLLEQFSEANLDGVPSSPNDAVDGSSSSGGGGGGGGEGGAQRDTVATMITEEDQEDDHEGEYQQRNPNFKTVAPPPFRPSTTSVSVSAVPVPLFEKDRKRKGEAGGGKNVEKSMDFLDPKLHESTGSGGGENHPDHQPPLSSSPAGLLSNTDVHSLRKFLNPWTLHFRSTRTEEIYFRDMILPNKTVHLRVFSLINLISLVALEIFYPAYIWRSLYYRISSSSSESMPSRPSTLSNALPGYVIALYEDPLSYWRGVLWSVSFAVSLFLVILTSRKYGIWFVRLHLRSRKWRYILQILEGFNLISTAFLDFWFVDTNGMIIGSVGTLILCLLCLTSGVSGTYVERVCGVVGLAGIVIAKVTAITMDAHLLGGLPDIKVVNGIGVNGTQHVSDSSVWKGWVESWVYALPLLTTAVLVIESLYEGDRDRRIR
jgi:hypothetical protein